MPYCIVDNYKNPKLGKSRENALRWILHTEVMSDEWNTLRHQVSWRTSIAIGTEGRAMRVRKWSKIPYLNV